jgi:hypothetical protein
MSKIEVTKVCEFCGKKFTAHKMTTRFCSHQCSQRNYKTEKREQKLEKVLEGENLPSPSPTTLKKEYLSCEDVAELMRSFYYYIIGVTINLDLRGQPTLLRAAQNIKFSTWSLNLPWLKNV